MKKITLISLLITSISIAQNTFQGTAIYESKTDVKSIGIDMPGMDEETKAKMLKKLASAFEKTFILNFNTFESTYFEEQKLKMQNSQAVQFGGNGITYKNIKEQIQITEEEAFNKNFLISEDFKKWDWQLMDESKKIGEYNCQKAMVVIPVSDEEKLEYEKEKKNHNDSKTSFLKLEEPQPVTITVWYTTEIPVANGPENYWGLPGLILEVNNGKTAILCSKIILNPKEKIAIKRPTKGKKITRSEFEKMSEEKLNSMKDADGVIHLNVIGN